VQPTTAACAGIAGAMVTAPTVTASTAAAVIADAAERRRER
jgi:hypothetical protein